MSGLSKQQYSIVGVNSNLEWNRFNLSPSEVSYCTKVVFPNIAKTIKLSTIGKLFGSRTRVILILKQIMETKTEIFDIKSSSIVY